VKYSALKMVARCGRRYFKSSEKVVLYALLIHAQAVDDAGDEVAVALSMSRLSTFTSLHLSTVKRVLSLLEAKGLIEVHNRWILEDGSVEYERPEFQPEQTCNLYKINLRLLQMIASPDRAAVGLSREV